MRWFKHFSCASDDEFIAALEDKFGMEGYARWWKMLEVIAKQMDETSKCHAEYSWEKWQSFLRSRRKPLEQFLMFCEKSGKIKLEDSGEKSGRSPGEVAEKLGRSGTSTDLLLKIICPNMLKLRDNHTKNLQVTCKQEVEVEVDLKALKPLSKSEKPDSDGEVPKPEIVEPQKPKKPKTVGKETEPETPPPTEARIPEPQKPGNPEPDPQPPPKAKSDPRIKELIDFYHDSFIAETGQKPLISGKEAKIIQRLLATFEVEKIRENITRLLQIDDDFIASSGRTLGVLQACWQKITLSGAGPPGQEAIDEAEWQRRVKIARANNPLNKLFEEKASVQ